MSGVPSTKEAALRVAALMLAAGGPGDDTVSVVREMRHVLAPIHGDADQLEWTAMYMAMTLVRTIRIIAPYVAHQGTEHDLVREVVVQIMEQCETW